MSKSGRPNRRAAAYCKGVNMRSQQREREREKTAKEAAKMLKPRLDKIENALAEILQKLQDKTGEE